MSSLRPPIAVVAALRAELAGVLEALDDTRGRAEGTLAGRAVRLAWTGDGARSARAGLEALLDRSPVAGVLVLGVAGGLSPNLAPGVAVAAERVVDAAGEPAPAPDAEWRARVVATAPYVVPGTFASRDEIAVTAAEKAELWRRLGAPEVATVDLETAAWARVAAARGVPYLAVRAISDTAGETLPLDFNRYRDRHGRVSRLAVAARALRRPSMIRPLRALERRVAECAERLAGVALVAVAEAP